MEQDKNDVTAISEEDQMVQEHTSDDPQVQQESQDGPVAIEANDEEPAESEAVVEDVEASDQAKAPEEDEGDPVTIFTRWSAMEPVRR